MREKYIQEERVIIQANYETEEGVIIRNNLRRKVQG